MPLICTKNRDKLYCAITTRLLTKKLKEEKNSNISVPSSLVHGNNLQKQDEKSPLRSIISIESSSSKVMVEKISTLPDIVEKVVSSGKLEITSIISSSQKLKELKELCELLKKIPDEPKSPAPIQPRKPTLESIKEAIEMAKVLNRNKNVGTEDDIGIVSVTDASTETEPLKRKLKRKETSTGTTGSHFTNTSSSPTTRKSLVKTCRKKANSKYPGAQIKVHSCVKKEF